MSDLTAAQYDAISLEFSDRFQMAGEVWRLRGELDAVRQERDDAASTPLIAPVQGYSAGIPWDMHLLAYDAYCREHGKQQSLIEGSCRGGFGVKELDHFIPGWRAELSIRKQLQTTVESLRADLAAMTQARDEVVDRHTVVTFAELTAEVTALKDALRQFRDYVSKMHVICPFCHEDACTPDCLYMALTT